MNNSRHEKERDRDQFLIREAASASFHAHSANQLGEPLYKNSQQQVKILRAPSKPEINIHICRLPECLSEVNSSLLINHPAKKALLVFIFSLWKQQKMLRVALYYFDFKMQIFWFNVMAECWVSDQKCIMNYSLNNALCFQFLVIFVGSSQTKCRKNALKLYTLAKTIYLLYNSAGEIYPPPKAIWMPGSGVEWRNGMVRTRHVMRLAIAHLHRCLPAPSALSRIWHYLQKINKITHKLCFYFSLSTTKVESISANLYNVLNTFWFWRSNFDIQISLKFI